MIDTAGASAYVLVRNGDMQASTQLPNEKRHSDVLLGELDGLLRKVDMKVTDLDYMGVVTGPGSFTGIRIGIATIKGFAAMNNCNLIGLTVFDVLSEEVASGRALLKCTKTSCYYADYKNYKIIGSGVIDNSELQDENYFVVAGDGLEGAKRQEITDYEELLKKAMEKAIKTKNFVQNNKLEAVYMQKPQAER